MNDQLTIKGLACQMLISRPVSSQSDSDWSPSERLVGNSCVSTGLGRVRLRSGTAKDRLESRSEMCEWGPPRKKDHLLGTAV